MNLHLFFRVFVLHASKFKKKIKTKKYFETELAGFCGCQLKFWTGRLYLIYYKAEQIEIT